MPVLSTKMRGAPGNMIEPSRCSSCRRYRFFRVYKARMPALRYCRRASRLVVVVAERKMADGSVSAYQLGCCRLVLLSVPCSHSKVPKLVRIHVDIDTLRNFFVNIMKRWANTKDRVIGYVEWISFINVAVPPHSYTGNFCAIKLYKMKIKDFIGNFFALVFILILSIYIITTSRRFFDLSARTLVRTHPTLTKLPHIATGPGNSRGKFKKLM